MTGSSLSRLEQATPHSQLAADRFVRRGDVVGLRGAADDHAERDCHDANRAPNRARYHAAKNLPDLRRAGSRVR